MKIDGIQLTLEHVGRKLIIIEKIDTYLPRGFITKIAKFAECSGTISVVDQDGDMLWLSDIHNKKLGFTNEVVDKVSDLFTIDDNVSTLDTEGAYEHRKTVAKKIQMEFNTMVTLRKELASAEYLYHEAIIEGDTLSLVVNADVSSSKIKVSYQPEVIVFVGE